MACMLKEETLLTLVILTAVRSRLNYLLADGCLHVYLLAASDGEPCYC